MSPLTAVLQGAGPGFHPRACAGGALASAGVHLWMAGQHSGVWWQWGLMLTMAFMCLPCVLPLWREGSRRAARMLMGGALFMVALHAALLLIPAGSGAGHQHGGAVLVSAAAAAASASAAGSPDGAAGSPFGILALIAGELAVAMLAATWLRRRALSGTSMFPAG